MPSLKVVRFSAMSLLVLSSTTFAQSKTPASGEAKAVPVETFAIPDSVRNIEQFMAFVEEIDSLDPTGDSKQERVSHQRKVARTVVAAAEKILSEKLSDEDAMQGVFFKLQGLRILHQGLGDPNAGELLSKAITAALEDKRADVQAVGTKFMLETGFAQWATWGKEERAEFIARIIKVLSSRPPEARQVAFVKDVVGFLGDEHGEVYARQILSKMMPLFQSSEDPQIQQEVISLQGIERRMGLPGNPIELTGTMLDGSTLDWQSYRGKVVLVDFWATWCGPCRADVPNILKMYRAYHDKGFEVIGISLDDRPEQAESFIKQEKIPWPTLFSDNPAERGWQHPMAVRYGIDGIPRAILVDRDGKVVHMTARGANLVRELRRLLGEPVARSQQRADAFVQQVSNPPSGK